MHFCSCQARQGGANQFNQEREGTGDGDCADQADGLFDAGVGAEAGDGDGREAIEEARWEDAQGEAGEGGEDEAAEHEHDHLATGGTGN